MEGDGLLHPRGPLPPAIYWRRRLTVLAAALVLIFLVAKCAPGGDTDKTAATPSASASSSPKASAKSTAKPSTAKPSTATSAKASTPAPSKPAATAQPSSSAPAAPAECKPPDLQVSVQANAASYPAGVSPVLTMTIKNAGKTPCVRDLGPAATELKVTSGSDRIWSSDDCSKGGPAKPTVLKAGEVKTVAVTWNRKRSRPTGTCVGADALTGNYRVEGRLGDLGTLKDAFRLA